MKRIKNLSRRGLALLMTLTMCLSLLPATAMAEGVKHDPSTHITENGWTCVKGELLCTKASHEHGAGCYGEAELTCNIPEAHEHDVACYDADGELICGCLTAHEHTDVCYETEEVQVCQEEEHEHTDTCYDTEGNLICQLEEHEHTGDCYETRRGEQLICELEEVEAHEHGTACYGEAPLTCQLEEHEHTDGCYAWTCTHTEPVKENQIPGEVRAFVEAVAALPEAEEITVENAVEVSEQLYSETLSDQCVAAESYLDVPEVSDAYWKYAALIDAVDEALELVVEMHTLTGGLCSQWSFDNLQDWINGNESGNDIILEPKQNSDGANYTFTGTLTIPAGKTVTVKNTDIWRGSDSGYKGPLFKVEAGATLNLESMSLHGTEGHNYNGQDKCEERYNARGLWASGSLVEVESDGTLNLNSGAYLHSNGNKGNGGGVYVHNGGTLVMNHGSKIENCDAVNGGGVFVENGGTFDVREGEFIGCRAIGGTGGDVGHGEAPVVTGDPRLDSQPVYLAILKWYSEGIPGEPAVSGRDYVAANSNYTIGNLTNNNCVFSNNASTVISKDIFDNTNFRRSIKPDDSTLGLVDGSGRQIEKYLTGVNFDTYLQTMADKNAENANDADVQIPGNKWFRESGANPDEYRIVPYVIKYQSGNTASDGWHIDCILVPKIYVLLSYDINLPDGVIVDNLYAPGGPEPQEATFSANVEKPVRKDAAPVEVGSVIDATYNNTPIKLKFLGWKTDSEDQTIYGAGTSNSSIEVIKDTVLYAQWEVEKPEYKVEFYYQNAQGVYPASATKAVTRNPSMDEFVAKKVEVEKSDKAPQNYDGISADNYVLDEDKKEDWAATLDMESKTVLKVYFKLKPKLQITAFDKVRVDSVASTDTLVSDVGSGASSAGYATLENNVLRLPATKPLLYKLTVTGNPGAAFVIEEQEGVTLVGATDSSVELKDQKLTGTIPTADGDTAGTTKSVTIYVSMDAPTLTGDAITMDAVNKATLTAGDKTEISPDGETSRDKIEKEVKTPASKVALSVTKTTTATTVKPDETITWTITVENKGKVPAKDVKLSDEFKAVAIAEDKKEAEKATLTLTSIKIKKGETTEDFDLENGTFTVPAATSETAPGTVTFTATYKVPESAKVGEGESAVDLSGLTLKNVAEVTYGKEEPIPSEPSKVEVTQYKISKFEKVLATTKDDMNKAGLTELAGIDIAKDGTITVKKDAPAVQLLYKLTVTGDPGASYKIEDPGVDKSCIDKLTGTLAETDTAVGGEEGKVTKTIYVTMTFTKGENGKFTVTGQGGALTNKAEIKAAPDKPIPGLPENPSSEVKSYLLTVEYKVDSNGTKPTGFPDDYTQVVQTGSYDVAVPAVAGYGVKSVVVGEIDNINSVSNNKLANVAVNDADVKVVVTYSKNNYALTVNLVDDKGQPLKIFGEGETAGNSVSYSRPKANDEGWTITVDGTEVNKVKGYSYPKSVSYNGTTYAFDMVQTGEGLSGLTGSYQQGTEAYTVNLVYSEDVVGGTPDPDNTPDTIPDKYQVKVTFQVENGFWNKTKDSADNNKADVIIYLPKYAVGENGEYVKDTEGKQVFAENGTAKLEEKDIPAAGQNPAEGFIKAGRWTLGNPKTKNVVIPSEDTITEDTVYVYYYTPEGEMTVTVHGYTGVYDGRDHADLTDFQVLDASGKDITNDENVKITYTVGSDAYTRGNVRNVSDSKTIHIKVEYPDYKTQEVDAAVRITPAVLTVTANDQSKTYNGRPFTGFTHTISGFVNGETRETAGITGDVTYEGTAVSAVSTGRYTITPVVGGLRAANYTFRPADGILTITRAYEPYVPDPAPSRPTPRPTPIPDDPTPVDPGTSIDDETTPLAGAVGLNNVDHFAYIVGYDDNTVRPTNNITRAEVATIFFRLMEDDYRAANWATENSFSDVSVGQWYNNAISTCARAGALGGYEDGSFRPENPITRAEFAVIASRFLGAEYTDEGVGDFSDTQGHWAAKEIRRAVKAGWITGEGNKFRPEDPITRAEVMTIVNRMLDRLPDAEHFLPDMIHWIDNPEGTWYYEAVQEATNEHAYERDELNAETWTQLLPARKWAELEKSWADAYAAG